MAETSFCRIGAKGMMLSSTLLPLAFSYSATALRSDMSSSSTKPCANHIVIVLAWALAIYGRARVQAAPRPTDPCSSERRVKIAMVVSSPVRIAHLTLTLYFFVLTTGDRSLEDRCYPPAS